jgi:ribose-phosphate pyrophosphokinase
MNKFIICATRPMKQYAARVIEHLAKYPIGIAAGRLSDSGDSMEGVELLQTDRFADGEMEVTVKSSVRGKDVVVFTSSARNETGVGVEEAKIELYHTVDALKRSHAARVIVFEPFMSCSRSDRTNRRSSVGLWVHVKTLVSLGASHIVTYQLHSDKSKSMVDPTICAFDDIPALTLLNRYLCDVSIQNIENLNNEVRTNWAFCSVDAGGEKIARVFANAFQAPLVIAHKQRDPSHLNTVESINILSAEPVKDKTLWIVDDMVDTAGSVQSLIGALVPQCPKEINLMTVHPVLSPPAAERIDALIREGLLRRIIVTDTVCCSAALREQIPNIEIVSSAALSAKIISAIICNSPMNKLLRPFDAEIYLKSPNLFSQ